MGMKKWVLSKYDKELAKDLSIECETDPIVALIASSRGYTDPMDLEQFLSDEPMFCDFYEMADITEAAFCVNDSIEKGEKIAVYGDYDCDGVTATALLFTYLSSRGADCTYYIPNRFDEGYGMNNIAVDKLKAQGVQLIITVDNGISCYDEIEYAKSLGIKVVVTDHHLPHQKLPDALAVVDPYREDCLCEFKSVCGAEVAFRLICVMENKEPEELLYDYADLLTIAVIADVMPLVYENRSIVKCGVEKIKNNPSVGIKALLNVAGIDSENIDATKVAFGICPRINAAGRMGDAAKALELLITDSTKVAFDIAGEIDGYNSKRKSIEKEIFNQAVSIIEENKLYYNRVIVVAGNGWHQGVVGIVAARICEKYGCPAILLSVEGDTASGSGRAIPGFSLLNSIDYCKELLEKYGGHEGAAGLTLNVKNIDSFRIKINEYAHLFDYVEPKLMLDCKLNPSALSLDLAYCLKKLEPFGTGNNVPVFGVFGVTLLRIVPIGNNKHLRLLFKKGDNSFMALLFGVNSESFCFNEGDLLDLAVTVDVNSYKGEENVSVLIKAVRTSGIDDTKLFDELSRVNDFYSGVSKDTDTLLPSREDIGTVYKKLCEKSASEDEIIYSLINSVGYAKTRIAIDVLKEICLVEKDNTGKLSAVKNAEKRSLTDSDVYRALSEG